MLNHPAYAVEPWCLRESQLDPEVIAQGESVFALSNGHIGWRGNLDEGHPFGLLGSYLNGVHELRPLPYAEAGYGYPEQDQVIINVTDGKIIRLLVDDEPFDLRYGTIHHHERLLDFRTGLLRRETEWSSPSGKRVRVRSTRLVSLVQRSVAAISYSVEAIDDTVRIVVQSELVANEAPPPVDGDPRSAASLENVWLPEVHEERANRIELVHSTTYSQLMMAAAMDHEVNGPSLTHVHAESAEDLGRLTISSTLEPGERLDLVKYVSYGWSAERTKDTLRDQVDAGLVVARETGWDGLVAKQRGFLDDFWRHADVEIDGDDEIQQAVRFSLFHLLQASARNEERAIAAKGLTGTGYDGHAFWDSESFVLSVLTFTMPKAVAHALSWRHGTIDLAKERAAQLELEGAAFPWRTITGLECSAYWPAGTGAFHVTADIAGAVVSYLNATGDEAFERTEGLELLCESARLWSSLGHFDRHGGFRIDGVTGPDEYSAIADNNIYTNLMAQQNLLAAADVAERHRDEASALGVDDDEIALWRRAGASVLIPYDEGLGIHPQNERFTDHEVWDFDATTDEQYPLFLHHPYFDLYRKQVVKQADLVLAMYFRGDAFTPAQKKANFEYYEALTVRDSSLSACSQAVMAAEVGHLDLAYDYLAEAALMDLDDLEHNTRDGLHIASLAGTWIALVAGLGGMRSAQGAISFAPRLPDGLHRLAFNLTFRGRHLHVEATSAATTYTLRSGDDLEISHFETTALLSTGTATVLRTPSLDESASRLPPRQPHGRAPLRRVTTRTLADEEAP